MERTSSRSKGIVAALVVISGILGLLRLDSFQVGAFPDDAHYIVLAESLASGQGYRLINFPDAPVETTFPPGWPLLLAPVSALFPASYTALKFLSLAFWLASLLLIYRFFAGRLRTPYLEALIALIALNPIGTGFSGMIMSETSYIFFSFLVLYLFDRRCAQQSEVKILPLIAIAVFALYTQLIRTTGLSIIAALIGYLLFSRRFRQAGIVTAVILSGFILQLYFNPQNTGSIISPGYHEQALNSPIATKITHILINLHSYAKGIISGGLVFVFKPESMPDPRKLEMGRLLLNAVVLVTIVIGVIRAVSQRFHFSELYAAIYFAGVLSFWNPGVPCAQVRYLVPVIPFLYFYMIRGIEWFAILITGKHSGRHVSTTTIGLILPIILLSLAANFKDLHEPARDRFADLSAGAGWIAANAPKESVIMAANPITDYLYAKRKTVGYPFDAGQLEDYVIENSVDYIVISPRAPTFGNQSLDFFTENLLLPALTANPDMYFEVYKNATCNASVFRTFLTDCK